MTQQHLFDLIEAERIKRKLTVIDLATTIGTSKQAYRNWRNGSVSPNVCSVLKLMDYLGLVVVSTSICESDKERRLRELEEKYNKQKTLIMWG